MANSSAIFSRIKNWGATDTLTAADLNAEFNNILTNFTPAMMGGYSFNVAQMQIQTAPGGVGSESLAASLGGELERLRYQLSIIQGTTFWYQTPAASLATLNSALGTSSLLNRVSSGVTSASGQPAYLVPDGTTNKVTLSTSTALVYSIQGTQYSISSNVTLAGLATAGASSASTTCVINDPTITAGQAWTQYLGENGSTITVATAGTSITSQIGKIVGFKNSTSSELFIGRVASSTALMDCYRGYFQTGASSFSTRSNVTNGDVLELMQLTWIFATTAGALLAVSTNPTYSGTAPSGPGTGDYWFDEANNVWKTYNGTTWIVANATLVGITIQDPTKCVGSRAIDFFEAYNSLNTVELFDSPNDTSFAARSRYLGSTVSVYGTTIKNDKGYWGWTANGTGLIDSTTLTTGNIYYFYISNVGNTYVSSIMPYNRQEDLFGYYHPSSPYRCVGYALCTTSGSQTFGDIESFFKNDQSAFVGSVTTTGNNLLYPYVSFGTERIIECNANGGAITQDVPPPSQWRGQRITYVKVGTDFNAVTLQAWGSNVLTTTANVTQGNTTIGTLASTTGLVASQPYLISGPGISPGTTVTWASGSSAVLSQNSFFTTTGSNYTFAFVPSVSFVTNPNAGIQGNFTISLNQPGESVELYSNGTAAQIIAHYWPSSIFYAGTNTVTGTSANPTKGTVAVDQLFWQRISASQIQVRSEYRQTAAGSSGTGDYLWAVPNSLSIDITRVSSSTTVYGNTAPINAITNSCGSGSAYNSSNSHMALLYPSVYDATHVRNAYDIPTLALGVINAAGENSFANVTVAIGFSYIVPISGWGNF